MIYFDNAATGGRKPDAVISAVTSAVKLCANPGRSGHKLSLACAGVVQNCRNALDEYFNGWGFERVIFTKNCTEALNIAVFGALSAGDHVVTTCMEHNSVLRPLEYLKKSGVITYDVCPLTDGNICPETFASLIKPETKMAIVTSASNVTGAIPPLKEIKELLPERVLFVCDGAQGGGHIPIDMKRTGLDALAIAGHKGMMGIQGSGALLFSERINPRPVMFGGTGSESISLDMPDFYPDANAQGAPNGGGRPRESELFSFQSQKGNRRTPFRPEKNELTFPLRLPSVGLRFFSAFRPRISIYGAVRRPEAAKIVRKKCLSPHWKASPRACFFPLR